MSRERSAEDRALDRYVRRLRNALWMAVIRDQSLGSSSDAWARGWNAGIERAVVELRKALKPKKRHKVKP